MKKTQILAFLLQFLPLSIFVIYAYWDGPPNTARWLNAFTVGGIAAVLHTSGFALFSKTINRLILGANVYLIVGGFLALMHVLPALRLLNDMREAGVMTCIAIVGFVTTFFSPAGFIGLEHPDRRRVVLYSALLLLMSLVASFASFYNRGNTTVAAVIPIIILSIANRVFISRIRRATIVEGN